MPVNLANLKFINQKIKSLSQNVDLMAVTKNRPKEDVLNLIKNGVKIFGENRVQEAKEKFSDLFSRDNFSLHLIGPLQTNKVKDALKIFNTIQTIDRIKLVDEIVKLLNKDFVKTNSFYIQINIGHEDQKSGVHKEDLDFLYKYSLDNGLNIQGFMCIPPANQDPTPYFQEMIKLKDKINSQLKLSMGMSNDYDTALSFNTNLIRLGSILFND